MAKRISLRQFQQDLVKRLNEAATAPVASARLGVQVGNELWLIRLEEAGEVIPVSVVTHVPLVQPWFRGLANIRGNLYSAIDFSLFQGGEATPLTPDSRLLLVAERFHMNAALVVNKMLGLRSVAQFESHADKPERPWEAGRFVDREGRMWRELGMSELVYHGDFLQAGV